MASSANTLDDHQKFVLMQFRRNVSDVVSPEHDDNFLLRWLRARSWNAEAAEKMLRQSLKWRQQWEVDGNLKTWQPPEPMLSYFPYGFTGFSKDRSPVIVVPFAGLDIVGVLHAFGRENFIKLTIQTLEKHMQLAKENGNYQMVVVFDMEAFNIMQYTWRPAAEVVITLIKMYEANYPEILNVCFIINAPQVFAIAFNVVKRFLNEYTLSKIKIFKNDPKKWKKILLEHIDENSLPAYYGGNLTDPDGNPKYTTKVVQGGKVPKHLYQTNEQTADSIGAKQYTSTVIRKGDKLVLNFQVLEEGSFLKWDFYTEEHDIRFGITLKDSQGTTSAVIHHKRIATREIHETGIIACQAPATYIVTFDNTYSLLRSKKLHYDVSVIPRFNHLDDLTNNEEKDAVCESSELATTSSHT